MKTWEYAVEEYQDDLYDFAAIEAELDKWGDEGWELITVVKVSDGFRYYFKRRI